VPDSVVKHASAVDEKASREAEPFAAVRGENRVQVRS